jgi:ABC-type amino acid transport substrate-binding protein
MVIGPANAESIRWVTESWHNYTNKDGSGLYNDIVKEVFADHELVTVYIPWKRALLEVRNGTSDMTGATSAVKGYAVPRASILTAPISVLFNKKHITYSDFSSLANHIGVWPSPYEDELFLGTDKALFNGFSVQERETAYKMLMSGRADYFLDTKALHQAWLASQEVKTKGKITANDFDIVDISHLNLYMIFTDNERGHRLKNIFDTGIEKLRQQGKLRKIYEKYNFLEQMPSK